MFWKREFGYEEMYQNLNQDKQKDEILRLDLTEDEMEDFYKASWLSSLYLICTEDKEYCSGMDRNQKKLVREF